MNKILIVGGGLAGICLAFHLKEEGADVMLLDDGKNASSAMAAGLVNPMSFRRTLLSWRVAECYNESLAFYQKLEQIFDAPLIHPIKIRRLFASQDESCLWKERMHLEEYKEFTFPLTEKDACFLPFGSGTIKGFWVDSARFISESHSYFEGKNQLISEVFNPDYFVPEQAIYRQIKYDKVVFALGYRNHELPWFRSTPVECTKGQILTAMWDSSETTSLHRKAFALPIGGGKFKIGSTYEWKNATTNPTEEGRTILLNNFKSISSETIEIIDHTAGVRPTTPDRRPIIGVHPEHSKLYIFNGLGAKGYMTAPLMSKLLVQTLLFNSPIWEEVNALRFHA